MDPEFYAVSLVLGLGLIPMVFAIRGRWLRIGLVACWLVIVVALPAGFAAYRDSHREAPVVDRPVERLHDGYVGSHPCGACHPDQHDSWANSWHRTMTQVASPESVIGDFYDVTLDDHGRTTKLERRGDEFFAHVYDSDRRAHSWRKIVMTTGSHHMQVYWYSMGPGKALGQLGFVYLKNDRRWVPRKSIFVRPPSSTDSDESGRWNTGCIQCHTVRGRPGMKHRRSDAANSDAAQFGIACEACHGPGADHVRANGANPARRYARYLSDDGDPTIVNPVRLSKERAADVCGRCHGIPRPPKEDSGFLQHGVRFDAGEELAASGRIIVRGGPNRPEGMPQLFHDSVFWSDGMVRVSGREVNGMFESPCYQHGEMTCSSCHLMHRKIDDSRPRDLWADDQLHPDMRTNEACLQCHESFATKVEAHGHHPAGSSGSECMNCHMPFTTWGLLKAMRQHEIDSPSVQATVDTGRPNACNACHLDRTLRWTAEHLSAWYDQPMPELSKDEGEVAASLLWLLKGDAGQRGLASWYFGWLPGQETSGSDWMAPHLSRLLDDRYAAVRYRAGHSLAGLPGFEDFDYDYVGSSEQLVAAKRRAMERYRKMRPFTGEAEVVLFYADGSVNEVAVERLLDQRDDRDVMLGE